MLNRVCLVGRLTADPELRYTPNGVAVANFRIAVDRDYKNAQGDRDTDFINIVAWRQRAEFVSNFLTKGRLVSVDGRLQVRTYETQDGQRRQAWDVVADSINFLDSPRDREAAPAADAPPPVADDLAPPVTDLDADANPWGDQ